MIRAAAIKDLVGDFQRELLSAGHAIIHDKIVVIDPMSETDCVVITGSHNLGFKASYANDENMLVLRGNRPWRLPTRPMCSTSMTTINSGPSWNSRRAKSC